MRTIAANIVEDFSPFDGQHIRRGTPLAGVQHIEGALSHLGEHRQLHRHVGLDDRRQSVLSIHQHPVHVEGDALVGHHPLPPPHRLGERAHHRRGHRSIRRVRRQQLRRPPRGDHLHPAPHANHPLLSRLPIGHLPPTRHDRTTSRDMHLAIAGATPIDTWRSGTVTPLSNDLSGRSPAHSEPGNGPVAWVTSHPWTA